MTGPIFAATLRPSAVMPGLLFKHIGILSAGFHQIFMCAALDDTSLLKNKDSISHPDGGKPVADEDGRPVF